ncbi:lactate utilization protein B/C [Aequorivita sp. H23M31]|uniref:Lactate utilization protein B/C n=1 Tax=Aequorivita ciconiae TaxID=2494375 RepID=A0A451FSC6_9FLAO|nr:LUD domain-containing protein [Aequorivita sp. H23M31]QAA80299.1 lactate utilization protein B/C [Aequorivita sp. H23M31]
MSLFKRLLNPNYKSEKDPQKGIKSDRSSYYPEQKLPVDEKFTHFFKNNGGKFIYCENWEEAMEAFDNIMIENDWYEQDVFCMEDRLRKKFDGFNLNFVNKVDSKFVLTTCESLVANTGAILLCSNQVKEKKLNELPYNMVVLATTSQIVENISEGLRIINNQRSPHIPSNITTVQNFESEKEKDFMTQGSSTKNLYLLLLEDL